MKKLTMMFVVAAVLSAALAGKARATMYEIGFSTPASTQVLVVSGAGTLNAIEISTGAAGDFCLFFDSATASGFLLDNTKPAGAASSVKEIGALAVAATNTTTVSATVPGRQFVNGLVAMCSALRRVHLWVSP